MKIKSVVILLICLLLLSGLTLPAIACCEGTPPGDASCYICEGGVWVLKDSAGCGKDSDCAEADCYHCVDCDCVYKCTTEQCCCEGVCAKVNSVTAGSKSTGETLYRANNYLDEPAKRTVVSQSVQASLSGLCTTCFSWSLSCPEPPDSYPRICPDDSTSATFGAKNHDTYGITAYCSGCFKSMNIAIEGINIYTTDISSEDEMTETYNIFLNENFDQKRESSTLPGHKQCYYVDNSDDSLTSPNSDNMLEIGAISIFSYIGGDTDATVKFNSSGIKLYDSSQDKNKLEFNTEYNILDDIGGSIYVEGISTGTKTLTATIKTQDGYTATDQLKIKVIPLDLVAVDPAPSSDQHEICHQDKLLIRVNNNDSDNDGIVDLLDFNIAGGDPELAKITLQKPTGAVDSDIGGGEIWVSFPSNLNAFNNQDKTGGEAPYSYSLSDLPKDIYLEGASASSDILDTSVSAMIYLATVPVVKCHDEIRYTVIKVDIVRPKGSLDAVINPEASWSSSHCYHFDFQGVISMATKYRPYVLGINGDIDPAPPLDYKWTLDAAAGTLTDDTTATPDHTAPATEGQGMLTLKAMMDTTDTGLKDERKVKIYKDHLARDYANFETGGSCEPGWKVTTFNVDPQPVMSEWNCHGSTWHHWDGSGTGNMTTLPPVGSPKKTVVVTHQAGGGGTHPPLGTLNRGDIVVYYDVSGNKMHSQTCTGSGTGTYGANNEPLPYPGAPSDQSWKWATSPAGDWANDLWLPGWGIMPVTIKVYDKP